MKLHIITVGKPKLEYAQRGWEEYYKRLQHYHQLRTTHLSDKYNDTEHLLAASESSYRVALVKEGQQLSNEQLATFLEKRALESREVSFIVGGPDGLPQEVLDTCDYRLSFGKLTLPHDLAMVVLLETLYRSSTISAGQPYHR
jgi:23S rRNA (pseudouridine1915-N3)-methyltransferase